MTFLIYDNHLLSSIFSLMTQEEILHFPLSSQIFCDWPQALSSFIIALHFLSLSRLDDQWPVGFSEASVPQHQCSGHTISPSVWIVYSLSKRIQFSSFISLIKRAALSFVSARVLSDLPIRKWRDNMVQQTHFECKHCCCLSK